MFFHKVARNFLNLIFSIKKWKIGKSRKIVEVQKLILKYAYAYKEAHTKTPNCALSYHRMYFTNTYIFFDMQHKL